MYLALFFCSFCASRSRTAANTLPCACCAQLCVVLSTASPYVALLPPTLTLPTAVQHYSFFSQSEMITSFLVSNKKQAWTKL